MTQSDQSVAPWNLLNRDATIIVARNSLLTGVLGGVAGSVVGTLRTPHVEPAIVTLRMTRRWFVFSFGFFALREYLVRPAAEKLWPMCAHPGHFQDIPPTFFSGALMGAVTAGFTRRPVLPGMFTISGLCTAAQLACNGFSLGFFRLVSTYYKTSSPKTDTSSAPITNAERHDALDSPPNLEPKSLSWFQKSYNWIQRHSPVQPITNDEYRQRLLTRQKEIDAELSLIEAELSQKRRALHSMGA